ncbi:tyrosine-type recombinase/integrase [Paenibacillus dendritiformis]|uniref:tyrosine-type recombinase/integrase n=1 Tax=Paenibacillus dendritiformis TaxID=130049 RepID=UPI00387E135A
MSVVFENVTKINSNRVCNHIISFLNGKKNTSKNTAKAYETDIKQFFLYCKGKTIEQLEEGDLPVLMSDIYDYRTYLLENKKYTNMSSNRKIKSVRSLYRFFKGNGYDVNPDAFNIGHLPDDSSAYGILTREEVFCLASLALESELYNPYMKRALILTAFGTSMREDALLNLTYDDIRASSEDPNLFIIEPKFLDKGKKIRKEIHPDIYSAILEARERGGRKQSDRIFTIDPKGICYMMKRLVKKAGFDSKRNITFHSLRKAGTEFVNEYTGGDMTAITAQGDWSSPVIPYKHYIKKPTNLAGTAAFENIDENVFDQLKHEDLLHLVKSLKNNGVGMRLKKEAKNILNKKCKI